MQLCACLYEKLSCHNPLPIRMTVKIPVIFLFATRYLNIDTFNFKTLLKHYLFTPMYFLPTLPCWELKICLRSNLVYFSSRLSSVFDRLHYRNNLILINDFCCQSTLPKPCLDKQNYFFYRRPYTTHSSPLNTFDALK